MFKNKQSSLSKCESTVYDLNWMHLFPNSKASKIFGFHGSIGFGGWISNKMYKWQFVWARIGSVYLESKFADGFFSVWNTLERIIIYSFPECFFLHTTNGSIAGFNDFKFIISYLRNFKWWKKCNSKIKYFHERHFEEYKTEADLLEMRDLFESNANLLELTVKNNIDEFVYLGLSDVSLTLFGHTKYEYEWTMNRLLSVSQT